MSDSGNEVFLLLRIEALFIQRADVKIVETLSGFSKRHVQGIRDDTLQIIFVFSNHAVFRVSLRLCELSEGKATRRQNPEARFERMEIG